MSAKAVSDLPQWLRDFIACPPKAGEGVHFFPFRAARHLHYHRPNSEDIFYLIKAALSDCGRPVPDREIWAGINDSKKCAWHPNKDGGPIVPAQRAWPEPDLEAIDTIVRGDLASATSLRKAQLDSKRLKAMPKRSSIFCFQVTLCCAAEKPTVSSQPLGEKCGASVD